MAHAYGNLVRNPVYLDLAQSINNVQTLEAGALKMKGTDPLTEADSCRAIGRGGGQGAVKRDTELGEMEFPVTDGIAQSRGWASQSGWSLGSSPPCHTRHQFAMEVARKPETCSECHKGPDVPAKKIYDVSKHGNIYHSLEKEWNFKEVPWKIGENFTAPTCAVCHMSLLVGREGEVTAQRSHHMSDRLPWRIFGPVYAHAHPKSPDTTIIRNKAGMSLPADLDGKPAGDFLVTREEQSKRKDTMQKVCLACHGANWVNGHWERFENTIQTTNAMTLTATNILLEAWARGQAKGPAQKDSLFNEPIEKKWVEQWLFYANSTRFSSAMCGADFSVFDNGRWKMSQNVAEMKEWLDLHKKKGK